MESKSKRVDQSLFFAGNGAGGMWRDAVWSATVTDPESGEVIATAINPGDVGGWAMMGIRLSREFLATLRELAGITAPLPVDQARAELAYWRESVEFAVGLLAKGRAAGQNIVTQSGHAEEYLRGLLALDGMPPAVEHEPCYDCRTTDQRLDALDRETAIDRQRLNAIRQRVTKLEDWMAGLTMRIGALEARPAFSMHERQRMDDIEAKLRDTAHRLEQVYVDHAETRSKVNRLEEKLNHVAGAVVMDAIVMDAIVAAMREQDGG